MSEGFTEGTWLAPCPRGTSDNSPGFQPWVCPDEGISPEGTAEAVTFSRPFGTLRCVRVYPGLNPWAILKDPFGMSRYDGSCHDYAASN
jgi:hypothetical protein